MSSSLHRKMAIWYTQKKKHDPIGSITIIDQHKILFPVVPNTIYFTRETKSPFTSWSRGQFFEGQ